MPFMPSILMNLNFAASAAEAVAPSAPISPGLEWTARGTPMHWQTEPLEFNWTARGGAMRFTPDDVEEAR